MKLLQDKNHHMKIGCTIAAGGLLGAIMFFAIYGFYILNPTYDDWLWAHNGDMTQHYVGWQFFRRSDWHFPLGMTDGLMNEPVSCMFTDSIPLFAIFFKLLSPILPETFQYIGLWGLLCYIAQGALAVILLARFNKSMAFCIIGSAFYIVSPVVLQRMFTHESLAGHWIILWSFILWAYWDRKWKFKAAPVILWTLNAVAAVLIHSYFLPMVFMVLLGYVITDIWKTKKILRSAGCIISASLFSLLTLFCIGAFEGERGVSAGGLGVYSSNLNSLFNGMGISKFIRPMNTAQGQYEGFGYLGLGMLLAAFLAIIAVIRILDKKGEGFIRNTISAIGKNRQYIAAFAAVMAVSIFMAASPICRLNGRTLYSIEYPDAIKSLLSIFRASGRFIWLTDYLIFTAVFALLAKLESKRTLIIALTLCLGIQMLDLRDFAKTKHDTFAKKIEYASPLGDPRWEQLAENSSELIFVPLQPNYLENMTMYFSFAKFACDHNMTLSSFYLARASYENMAEYAADKLELLRSGKGDPNALYIFTDKNEIPIREDVEVYRMNGYTAAKYTPN